MTAALIRFDELRAGKRWTDWRALTTTAPPFLGPEFFALERPFLDHGLDTLVAGAWSGPEMIGALPLVRERQTLRALRSDHAPGFDFCGTTAGLDAIWRCLRDDTHWSELVLDRVPVDSPLARDLPELAMADGCPAVVRRDRKHPYFELPNFEQNLKPKFLANLQRCERKAGDVVYERIAVPTRADLEDATRIEALAWKAAAGTSIEADPRASHLYHSLSRLLGRRGQASLAFLRVGGERIATLFVVEDRRTLYALKIGYDPRYANLSPGHLLVWHVAAEAERRGLVEFDFVGRDDSWKRKWTTLAHDQMLIVIYQRSARGLIRFGLRELVKPRLPATVRDTPRSPLPRRCQRGDVIGDHSALDRLRGRMVEGLGIRSRLVRKVRQWRGERRAPVQRLGEPSIHPVGAWVRVRNEHALREMLDDQQRTRGLVLVPAQLRTCSSVFRVASHVRRLRDDHGRFRPVSRTVLLEGVDCGYGASDPTGCGRQCPLMYRDEWLEPAPAPREVSSPLTLASKRRYARVRDASEITSGLDLFGRRDGLTFMPEMAAFAGRRFPIAERLDKVYELDRWKAPRAPVYLLEGLHCTGAICRDDGPCERACTLMWHEDWLVLEPTPAAGAAVIEEGA